MHPRLRRELDMEWYDLLILGGWIVGSLGVLVWMARSIYPGKE